MCQSLLQDGGYVLEQIGKIPALTRAYFLVGKLDAKPLIKHKICQRVMRAMKENKANKL